MQTVMIICYKNIWAYKKCRPGRIKELDTKELDKVCTTVIQLTCLNKNQHNQHNMQAYSKQKLYKILIVKYYW